LFIIEFKMQSAEEMEDFQKKIAEKAKGRQ
jgi:hypothetical protein